MESSKNIHLESGQSYNIGILFSGNRKIVIPDMQRDYCWASTKIVDTGQTLVQNYLSDLIRLAKIGTETRMGLLYAYEMPSDHIQLCDGQQRLTTLYLILGCAFKQLKTSFGNDNFCLKAADILISEVELHDDHEPRLQYAIRESTLMFLRDLVSSYFLGNDSDIKQSDWYFASYNEDPSIFNMVNAIEQIEDGFPDDMVDLKLLLEYIISKIHFLYFDMQSRQYGEEQFVVINTTGKQLTPTEHLKPKLLGYLTDATLQKKYADKWEDWEHFFWANRPEDDDNFTVDSYLREFFRLSFVAEYADTEPISDEREKYSYVQNVLAGGPMNIRKYNSDIQQILNDLQLYKEAIVYLHDNKIMVDSDYGGNVFSFFDIFHQDRNLKEHEYYRLTTRHCATIIPLLSYIKARLFSNCQPSLLVVRQLARLAWEVAQKNSSNYDVLRMVRFAKGITAHNIYFDDEAIKLLPKYEAIGKEIGFLKDSYLSVGEDDEDELSALEIEWDKLCHLIVVKGQCGFILETLDIICPESVRRLREILSATFEHPTNTLRRLLLSRIDYNVERGWSTTLNGSRYSFGTNNEYFFNVFHESKYENVKNEFVGFLQFIYNKYPDGIGINEWLKDSLNNCLEQIKADNHIYPSIPYNTSHNWSKTLYRLLTDGHWLDFSNGAYLVWKGSDEGGVAYMTRGYKVYEGTFERIIPWAQREQLRRINEKLKWSIVDGWKLRKEVKIEKSQSFYIEADFLSDNESLGKLCYSISARNLDFWNRYKERLFSLFNHYNKLDENNERQYMHIAQIDGNDEELIISTLNQIETDILKLRQLC